MLTQEHLKQLVNYDPDTGIFTRLCATSSRAQVGDVLGTPTGLGGHLRSTVGGKRYYLHKLAWLYVYGSYPELIDHINRDTTDNRICNLRQATKSQNSTNSKVRADNVVGQRGICFDKQTSSWRVQLCANGQSVRPRFKSFADAVTARDMLAAKLHKDFLGAL